VIYTQAALAITSVSHIKRVLYSHWNTIC